MKKKILAVLVVVCVVFSSVFMLTGCRNMFTSEDAMGMVDEMMSKFESNINTNITITRKEGSTTTKTEMKFREGIFSTKQTNVVVSESDTTTTVVYERYVEKSTVEDVDSYKVVQYTGMVDGTAQYQREVLPAEADFYNTYKKIVMDEMTAGIMLPRAESSITDTRTDGNDYIMYYVYEGTTNTLIFETYVKKINDALYSFYKLKSYTRSSDSYKVTYEFSYDALLSGLSSIGVPSNTVTTDATERFDWVEAVYPYVPPVVEPEPEPEVPENPDEGEDPGTEEPPVEEEPTPEPEPTPEVVGPVE